MNRELLELAAELGRQQKPFLTATVVWARGPSSGKRGSTAIIQPDGSVTGWIGGACAEPVVIRVAKEALADGQPRLLFLGTDDEVAAINRQDVTAVPISCTSEGALEVFLEPMLPSPYLVIIGRSPAVHALTAMAAALDWRVTVVDDGGTKEDHPFAATVLTRLVMPPDIETSTPIVVMTQGHYDEPALEAAIATKSEFIGLVASGKRAATVIGYLRDRGINESQLDRVHAPAGLDLGPLKHREIGIAVLADLLQRKAAGEMAEGVFVEPAHIAIDPVCGMEVDVATAKWITESESGTVYFCAPGCKATFEAAPSEFVSA
ncbi:MAG TPA: XdhC family protein [Acidimicrobiia bacterium]